MAIWFHRYELVPKRRLSAVSRPGVREGALLRIDEGFADLHPWPELGDPTLDEQLERLRRGEATPQVQASLELARLDREARANGRSLFDGVEIPESHWPGDDPPDGFDTIKIKDTAPLPPHVRVRIDFNERLTAEDFLRVAVALPREQIDFIEDPCPFDESVWLEVRKRSGFRLAVDRASASAGTSAAADVVVHKPALHARFPFTEREVVVTSYMDHPVGQFGAAYVAATHEVSSRCGLMTHVLYETNDFIERITCEGARLLASRGTGIGFDDLLERLPWKKLV